MLLLDLFLCSHLQLLVVELIDRERRPNHVTRLVESFTVLCGSKCTNVMRDNALRNCYSEVGKASRKFLSCFPALLLVVILEDISAEDLYLEPLFIYRRRSSTWSTKSLIQIYRLRSRLQR
ncbi:hypothetical protein PUN28_001692 [Cardiocondyla obscurior]|uniref:Secreted protein n=1 Tax=Cardiocondyla obscurior TaxID=286306 RepID=A0AAW2GQS0_9HYME